MREAYEHVKTVSRASAARVSLALGLLLPLACSEETERVVSGRYLDVTLPADVEICGGTIKGYDRFIEAAATRWGTDLDGWRVQMDVGSPGEDLGCQTGGSCAFFAKREARVVATTAGEHELVHLLTASSGSAFLTEGIATYWGSRPFSNWSVDPEFVAPLVESGTSQELLEVLDTGYQGAAAFTGLILDAFGVESYRAFYEAIPRGASYAEVGGVFEDVFGESMEPFVERLSTEPTCNRPIWACEHGIPTTLPIVVDGPLDCGDPEVQGFESDDFIWHAPKQALVFTLEEDTEVEFWLRNVDIVMANCGDCRPEEVQAGYRQDEDLIISPMRLTAGTWTVRISNRDHDDGYFSIRVLE